MEPTLIAAALSLAGSLIGTFAGILASSKMTNYRLEQLETKVSKHNEVVERTYKLEGQVLELQRQRITAALDAATVDAEARYGLTVLTTLGEDGTVIYNPDACIEEGRLTSVPQLRNAFCGGAVNASRDFSDLLALRRDWVADVLDRAELTPGVLQAGNAEWLGEAVDSRLSRLRERVRNVQLYGAARLQEYWAAHPSKMEDPAVQKLLDEFARADEEKRLLLAPEVAHALRTHCLAYLSREANAPMLP